VWIDYFMVAVRHPQLIADWVGSTRGASPTEWSSKVSDLPAQHDPLPLQTPSLLGYVAEASLVAIREWPDPRSARFLIAAHLFVGAGALPKSLSCSYDDRTIEAELLYIGCDIAICKCSSSPGVHKDQ
jgi:hypothetical protein